MNMEILGFFWLVFVFMVPSSALGNSHGHAKNVTYDGRSLIIDGQHIILFSGSIHYPRSPPEMWSSIIAKAKQGGIDVIQTYVFWNLHESKQGQFDFSGRRDIVRFIRDVQSHGLYVCLRIGPFIESEWTYGGLPFWLHDVPEIVFRSDNEPFKYYMQKWVTKVVNMMKSEKLYASQGGPIILSQIENEYQRLEGAFQEKGPRYVNWAAAMAVGLQTGVPWIMCSQQDAPDPVINTCNGFTCGVKFEGPNSPNKPSMWTENWTSFLQRYGEEVFIRSATDIAFQVALFIAAKKGSYVNYYMYHGGTNFGRTAAANIITSYYDQAPLDEYGLIRQPLWGHLKELHAAIQLCSKPLLSGSYETSNLGQLQVAYVFKGESGECAAFLVNNDNTTITNARVHFQNISFELPRMSISILPDCKNVAFNTAKVSTQRNTRSMTVRYKFDSIGRWEEYKETIPSFFNTSLRAKKLLDHMNTTKDTSDYLWYTVSFQHDSDAQAELSVISDAHVLHAFVNGRYTGYAHGGKKTFTLENTVQLNNGTNNIALLSVMVGFPDSGAYLERKTAGIQSVKIQDMYLNSNLWGYQVGLSGESSSIYTEHGSNRVQWNRFQEDKHRRRPTWYKTLFDAPAGTDPLAVNLGSMGKGEVWVNGQSIGRYWASLKTTKHRPSQTWYNVPRAFLKPTGNLLVLLEEEYGHPLGITLDSVSITKVCGHVSESHLPTVVTTHNNDHARTPKVQLHCPSKRNISRILFASFGNPSGDCNNYNTGNCHLSNSKAIIEEACLGKKKCSIHLSDQRFGCDPCPGVPKTLLIDAQCT